MALPGQFKFQAVCAGLFAVLGLVLLAYRDGRRANTRRDEVDAVERQV